MVGVKWNKINTSKRCVVNKLLSKEEEKTTRLRALFVPNNSRIESNIVRRRTYCVCVYKFLQDFSYQLVFFFCFYL